MESLKFKVILGTSERREAFLKAIKAAGLLGSFVESDFLNSANFAMFKPVGINAGFCYSCYNYSPLFEDCIYPLIRLDEAIARLEKYAAGLQPEFNIKPGDDVLVRDCSETPWRLARFSYVNNFINMFTCENVWQQIAPYKGNEKTIGNDDDIDYWRVEHGKPVLVKGESK